MSKKLAEKWAEEYMQTEEFKKEKEKWDKELQEFLLYGTPTKHLNDELITEIINYGNNSNRG